MPLILHIATQRDWDAAAGGDYRAPSLASAGFIHCSTAAQALHVANTYFRGRTDLVLLYVDTERLPAEVRWEPPIDPVTRAVDATSAERFPHLYGPIPRSAVVRTLPLRPGADGAFRTVTASSLN